MKLNYREILHLQQRIIPLLSHRLDAVSVLQLARLTRRVNSESELFIQIRNKLMQDYGISTKMVNEEAALTCEPIDTESQEQAKSKLKSFSEAFKHILASDAETDFPNDILIKVPESLVSDAQTVGVLAEFIEVIDG